MQSPPAQLWSTAAEMLSTPHPAAQLALACLLAAAGCALLFVHAPALVRMMRVMALNRSLASACQQTRSPARLADGSVDPRPLEKRQRLIAEAFQRSPLSRQFDRFSALRSSAGQAEGANVTRAPIGEVLTLDPVLGRRRSWLSRVGWLLGGLALASALLAQGLEAWWTSRSPLDLGVPYVGLPVLVWGLLIALVTGLAARTLLAQEKVLSASLNRWMLLGYPPGSRRPAPAPAAADPEPPPIAQTRDELSELGQDLRALLNSHTATLERVALASEQTLRALELAIARAAPLIERLEAGQPATNPSAGADPSDGAAPSDDSSDAPPSDSSDAPPGEQPPRQWVIPEELLRPVLTLPPSSERLHASRDALTGLLGSHPVHEPASRPARPHGREKRPQPASPSQRGSNPERARRDPS